MLRKVTGAVLCILVVLFFIPDARAQWKIYDASVLPSETGGGADTLDITNVADNSPGAGMILEVMDDPSIMGNKILKYLHPDGKTMFRHYFDESYTDTNFTIIARVRGENDPTYDRVFDMYWCNGNAGTRDELRLWGENSRVELEKANLNAYVSGSLYEWHTYRIVVIGDSATIYVDENPIPVVAGVSTEATTSNYIKVGDGSGDAIGGYMDWLILDLSGAYAPGEGTDIPEALHVDHHTTKKWLVYDASVLPSETDGGADTLDITNVADNSPGAGMVLEVMDDPDIVNNKILKYLHPDGKTMFRHYFHDSYIDSNFTMIARVKGEDDPTYDRVFDMYWCNGNAGTRDELRLWGEDSRLELEKADQNAYVTWSLYDWHTYRIVVTGDIATVYVDEAPTPVVFGESTQSSDATYFKLGDGSGDAIGGYLDWCILNLSGAYAPGEGPPIPEGLFFDTSTSVGEDGSSTPRSFQVWQNYPNPFNPETNIHFELPEAGHVTVTVYNALGEKVTTLMDAKLSSGSHSVRFNADSYATGIYFYEVKLGEISQIRKMMLMK